MEPNKAASDRMTGVTGTAPQVKSTQSSATQQQHGQPLQPTSATSTGSTGAVFANKNPAGQGEHSKTDPFAHLISEHNEFRDFVRQIDGCGVGSDEEVQTKRELVNHFTRELSTHTSVEEQWVHQLYKSKLGPTGQQYFVESLKADDTDKHLIDTLEKEPVTSNQWASAWSSFKAALADHMSKEENIYWPALSAALSQDEKLTLATKLRLSDKVAPTHPHPEGPSGPTGAKVMHPVVGVMDRATDAVLGRPHPEGAQR